MKRENPSGTVENIVPAPPLNLEIGEVGLPELVGRRGLVLELFGRLDDDVGWAGDEIVRLQKMAATVMAMGRNALSRPGGGPVEVRRAKVRDRGEVGAEEKMVL